MYKIGMRGPVRTPLIGRVPPWLATLRTESLYGSRASRFGRTWRVHQAPEDCCRLYWIRSGLGSLVHGSAHWALRPGTLHLIPAGRSMRSSVERTVCLHWAHVRLQVLGGIELTALLDPPCMIEIPEHSAYDALWGRYLDVLYRGDPAEVVLLDGLLREVISPLVAAALRQAGRAEPRFAAVIAYARAHLAEPLQLADLARLSGLERTHFARTFRAATGVSPMAWLRAQRVEAACADIAGGATLAEVARRWGYCDAFHLSKAVKAVTGRSPVRLLADWRCSGHGPGRR